MIKMQINFYKNKKSLLKLLLVLTLISYTIFYSSQKNIISGDPSYNNDELSNIYFPNTSDSEITIITPENKTYEEPMYGYYPATFGFENEADATTGTNIDFIDVETATDSSYAATIVATHNGHNKVLNTTAAGDNGAYVHWQHNFSSIQTSGTIEFFHEYKDNGVGSHYFEVFDDSDNFIVMVRFYLPTNIFRVYHGATFTDVSTVADTWYHIKIDFDCDSDTQSVWLNGESVVSDVPFYSSITCTTADYAEILFGGGDGLNSLEGYFDAYGFSWDAKYNIGDNLNEGLLLSYESSINLDWQGYSLDRQTNKTILGNATIPFPTNDGLHTIQVFGNNSLGTTFQSDIRYFTTQLFKIITPENKTYGEPMSGYYPATYGFENEADGTYGTNIDFIDVETATDSSYAATIVATHNGHNKVLNTTAAGDNGAYVHWQHDFSSVKTNGTIEFFHEYKDNGVGSHYIEVFDDSDNFIVMVRFYLPTNIFRVYHGATFTDVSAAADTWHHIKIDFDCDSDTQSVWLNGESVVSEVPFYSSVTCTTADYVEILFGGGDGLNSLEGYFDAFGASWDPNYDVGDNLIEGLLLSYDTTTTLEWQGYSIDGTANKTILGNTTIPIPDDGVHNIQVFGNDSLGTIYSSDIRYFSVDTLNPIITINYPLQNKYFGSVAPVFDLTIMEPALFLTWYTLDDGITNITFTGLTGTINQTEWDKKADGQVTIRFYANDTFGHLDYTVVLINKDTLDPVITINSPLVGEIFTDLPPEFNLTIDEVNLDTTWYTLDGGTTIIYFSELTGYIDSTTWNSTSIGAVTIRFYARDKAGNEFYQEIIVIKSSSQQELPEIPGFNITLLCLIIVIITASSLKFKKYKVK